MTESTSARQSPILDVNLPAFETGDASNRRAIVDGTMRSLATGFVYVRHDLSEDLLDDAYGRLADFFALPQDRKDRYTVDGANGQTGYTGLLVETAAVSDVPDWKEMLTGALRYRSAIHSATASPTVTAIPRCPMTTCRVRPRC